MHEDARFEKSARAAAQKKVRAGRRVPRGVRPARWCDRSKMFACECYFAAGVSAGFSLAPAAVAPSVLDEDLSDDLSDDFSEDLSADADLSADESLDDDDLSAGFSAGLVDGVVEGFSSCARATGNEDHPINPALSAAANRNVRITAPVPFSANARVSAARASRRSAAPHRVRGRDSYPQRSPNAI
jgi:hypothetical protein